MKMCEVCRKRLRKNVQFCSRCNSSVEEVDIFGHKSLCCSKNEKGYDIGNFYCEVILTEKRLVVVSNYRAGPGVNALSHLFHYIHDLIEDNPLIDIWLKDIVDVKTEIQDELFGSGKLTIVTKEGNEHCFHSLPKWFMIEIEKQIKSQHIGLNRS